MAMVPYREDCWSEGETTSLIDTWGARHEALNGRRNLSHKDWEEVASAVSSIHGSSRRRTAIQCKNRMGTLKKRYKVEKAASSSSSGKSRWPFYSSIDNLISIIGVKPSSSSSSSLPVARSRSTGIQVRKKKAVKEDATPTLYNYLQVVTMLASDNPSIWDKPFDWTQDPDQIPQARKYCLELAEREDRLERDRKMNPTVDLDENKRKLLSTQRLRQFIEGQIGQQHA